MILELANNIGLVSQFLLKEALLLVLKKMVFILRIRDHDHLPLNYVEFLWGGRFGD
jgi:hypothetical protein